MGPGCRISEEEVLLNCEKVAAVTVTCVVAVAAVMAVIRAEKAGGVMVTRATAVAMMASLKLLIHVSAPAVEALSRETETAVVEARSLGWLLYSRVAVVTLRLG